MKSYLDKGQETEAEPRKIVSGRMIQRGGDDAIASLFKEIEKAQEAIQNIKTATQLMKVIQDEALVAVGSEKEQQITDRLSKLIVQGRKEAATAKRILETVKKETEKMDKRMTPADVRVREHIHATCLQNLVVTVRAFQNSQQ